MTSELIDDEVMRYARQLILPEISDEGQDKLKASKLLIIGAGGLGNPALVMAAASGFGHVTVIDEDVIDITNLNRQFLYEAAHEGLPKADIAAHKAQMQNPHCQVTALTARFATQNANSLCDTHDVVIDASDNPETRLLANRACLATNTPLIFVSAIRFEGQMALFAPSHDEQSACYECLFPHQPDATDVPNCATVGILGPVTMIMGAWAVLEAIKWQAASKDKDALANSLYNQLLLFDGLQGHIDKIKAKKQPHCPACGRSKAG